MQIPIYLKQFSTSNPQKVASNQKISHSWRFSKPPNVLGNENPGEMGAGVDLPNNLSIEIQKLVDEGFKKNGFNQYISDLISFQRTVPDLRDESCKRISSANLPATSVVIIFHNEAFSTLVRSVHSVLDRSPEHLITEVLLVDDASDMGEIKKSFF